MKRFIVLLLILLTSCAPLNRGALPTATVSAGKSIASAIASGQKNIIVNEGTYNEGAIKLTQSGVTLQANGKVIINGAILIYGDNNVVRGFTITDKQQKAGIRLYGDYNLVEGNEIHDTLEDGIWFWGKGNTIKGNYIHNIYDDRNYPAYDNHVDCYMTMTWEAGNSAYNIAEDTVFDGNTCIHDRAHGSNQGVMVAGAIKNTTFRNNTFIFYDGLDGGYSPAFALYGGSGYVIENNYVCNTTGKGESVAWIEGATGVKMTGNTYAGYNTLARGSVTAAGNVKASLPCVIAKVETVTPTAIVTPTVKPTFTPTLTLTPTKVPTQTPTPTPTALCYELFESGVWACDRKP